MSNLLTRFQLASSVPYETKMAARTVAPLRQAFLGELVFLPLKTPAGEGTLTDERSILTILRKMGVPLLASSLYIPFKENGILSDINSENIASNFCTCNI